MALRTCSALSRRVPSLPQVTPGGSFRLASLPQVTPGGSCRLASLWQRHAVKLQPVERPSLQIEAGYIDGEWVGAKDSATFEVLNPASGLVIGRVPDMGQVETEEAIQSARRKFPAWRDTPAKERGMILRRWASLIQQNRDELGYILTSENGKPFAEARGEVDYAASFVDFYSEEARRIYGDVIPSPVPNKNILLLKQPIGVSGMITPWNVPSAMVGRKVAPALAAGCTVVLRPAEDTPYSALGLCRLAEEAGLPPGVLNVVTSSREKAGVIGRTLCEHPEVAHISFTGSTAVGKLLLRQAAEGVKKVSLELGGNAPAIVFNSANIGKAVEAVMASKFRGMGQACICTNRIFVQDGVYDEFLGAFSAAMSRMRIGDGMEASVTHGPLIHQRALEKVESLVEEALSKGATAVVGGKRHTLGGNFYEPTLLTNVTPDMACFQEEIFGPVAPVVKFKTEEEVIHLANNVSLGLAGYVYSSDISQIWRLVRQLEVGVMGVNEGVPTLAEGAFGGIKQSGLGREGSKYGIEDFLEIKYLCLGV